MNRPINDLNGDTPSAILAALRKILRSLVRLLLHFRVAFPQLSELLKSAYVEVAQNEFQLPNKPQTDTRISLLTGIHRKDIRRLRVQLASGNEESLVDNQGVRIVSRWISDPQYCDEQQSPLTLPFKASDGVVSFESLVQQVCRQDLRPRVVLDEWLRLGIVSLDDDNKLSLNTEAFVPSTDLDEKAFFLGLNVSDHINAITHNLINIQPALFERCVYYEGLSQESIEELKLMATEHSMTVLKLINKRAAELKALDTGHSNNHQRINFGIYINNETTSPGDKESS